MPFQETPEDVETGSYSDATVDETETVEEWIRLTAEDSETGERKEKAFGFVLIPAENVSWPKKQRIVQSVAAESKGGFDFVDYYSRMFDYQVQETSFLPDHKTVKEWATENASKDLLSKLEEHVPDPMDMGEEGITEGVLDVLETYAESDAGSWDADVEHFRAWLKEQSGVAEGDEGKLEG